ncbi:MAG: hypothetical protein EPO62_04025 [Candidatus Nitrosotenuis sp.]|nr:MAG: hypothetical protein EPO62_04025 [Candidatus Nitrosotenuis sp.]
MSFKMPKLEDIYDKIDLEESRHMSEADGYQWGLDYLNDTIKQLEKLERMALTKNNPLFYNDVKISIQRAQHAQKELQDKLTKIK